MKWNFFGIWFFKKYTEVFTPINKVIGVSEKDLNKIPNDIKIKIIKKYEEKQINGMSEVFYVILFFSIIILSGLIDMVISL